MKKILFLSFILTLIGCKNTDNQQIVKQNDIDSILPNKTMEQKKVFAILKSKDSLLFGLGFNQCDTNQVKKLTSKDLEFYHDQVGIMNSQKSFIQSIAGLCNMDYKPTRELVANSLSVHLLKKQGKIYGAIQNGRHSFYGEKENVPKYLTSTADFTHLWLLEENEWKLKRVLSYNHKEPQDSE